jgi:hypothetical protein
MTTAWHLPTNRQGGCTKEPTPLLCSNQANTGSFHNQKCLWFRHRTQGRGVLSFSAEHVRRYIEE